MPVISRIANKQRDMMIWGVGGIFWTFELKVFYELKPYFCELKIQPIWTSVWQFFNISYNPEISLLMMDPYAHQNTYAQMIIAALVLMTKTWKEPNVYQQKNR